MHTANVLEEAFLEFGTGSLVAIKEKCVLKAKRNDYALALAHPYQTKCLSVYHSYEELIDGRGRTPAVSIVLQPAHGYPHGAQEIMIENHLLTHPELRYRFSHGALVDLSRFCEGVINWTLNRWGAYQRTAAGQLPQKHVDKQPLHHAPRAQGIRPSHLKLVR